MYDLAALRFLVLPGGYLIEIAFHICVLIMLRGPTRYDHNTMYWSTSQIVRTCYLRLLRVNTVHDRSMLYIWDIKLSVFF